jgi:hypothetical protein
MTGIEQPETNMIITPNIVEYAHTSFLAGSFSPNYNSTFNLGGFYSGKVYIWNLTRLAPSETRSRSYSTSGLNNNYSLKRQFIVGID